jgi:hypothetical protein
MKNSRSFLRFALRHIARVKSVCGVFGIALLVGTGQAHSQSKVPAGALLSVPTTKVLALGHFTQIITPEAWRTIMPNEVRDTVKLYLAGKIDQWYVRTDQTGAVFVMNVPNIGEAQRLLEALPLGKANLMKFDLIELGPLSPLNSLLRSAAASAAGAAMPPQ